ncbi:hypothetical protein LR48_Vigan09g121900 [Vigna angularis]|uniref:Uncharacterized protein n=1 Tax=Phaseolus angularis TaxID=3914 RepID=A0A0L9VBX2_PHAAN|nr:hypothetical protein LR48_Vigan09g121900 [Vigna angularis]
MVNVMVMKEIEDTTLLLGVDLSILDLDSIRLPPSKTCKIVRAFSIRGSLSPIYRGYKWMKGMGFMASSKKNNECSKRLSEAQSSNSDGLPTGKGARGRQAKIALSNELERMAGFQQHFIIKLKLSLQMMKLSFIGEDELGSVQGKLLNYANYMC